jgi:hypothetical protein
MAAPGSSCRDDPESPIRKRPLAVPSDDLRLLVVYDRDARENHAVTVIRFEQRWPNRTNDIKDDAKATNLRPLFILGDPWARRATAGPKPTSQRQGSGQLLQHVGSAGVLIDRFELISPAV